MGRLGICNRCGYTQMIAYNAVDGRWKWWTTCENCKGGDFMSSPDPALLDFLLHADALTRQAVTPAPTPADTPASRGWLGRRVAALGRVLGRGAGEGTTHA